MLPDCKSNPNCLISTNNVMPAAKIEMMSTVNVMTNVYPKGRYKSNFECITTQNIMLSVKPTVYVMPSGDVNIKHLLNVQNNRNFLLLLN